MTWDGLFSNYRISFMIFKWIYQKKFCSDHGSNDQVYSFQCVYKWANFVMSSCRVKWKRAPTSNLRFHRHTFFNKFSETFKVNVTRITHEWALRICAKSHKQNSLLDTMSLKSSREFDWCDCLGHNMLSERKHHSLHFICAAGPF